MNKEFLILQKKFEQIKSRGWISVPRRGYGEVGMQLENILGLDNNGFQVADLNGIELKVSNRHSKYPLSLFSSTFEGPDFYELKRIVEKYGMRDYNYNNAKVLFISISAVEFTSWGRYLKMKLYIDESVKKIYLLIAHANGKIIEKKAYWNFSTLENILERKMNFLFLVTSDSFFIGGKRFVKYSEAKFFSLISFENFINLMKNGKITVNIKYGVYKIGKKKGLPYNHGIAFQIKKEDIDKLFKSIIF